MLNHIDLNGLNYYTNNGFIFVIHDLTGSVVCQRPITKDLYRILGYFNILDVSNEERIEAIIRYIQTNDLLNKIQEDVIDPANTSWY